MAALSRRRPGGVDHGARPHRPSADARIGVGHAVPDRRSGVARHRGFAVGGGSDGNFTAAIGVPTLDGLGAVGGGAHADTEHVVVDTMPDRAALVGNLVAAILARGLTRNDDPGVAFNRVFPSETRHETPGWTQTPDWRRSSQQ